MAAPEVSEQLIAAMKQAFAPMFAGVEARLTSLEASVGSRLDKLESAVASMQLAMQQRAEQETGLAELDRMRRDNSMKGPYQMLTPLTRTHRGTPLNTALAMPQMWGQLAVGGSECMPGRSSTPNWDRSKSKALLRAYYEDIDAASSGSEKEGNDSESERSRFDRIRVAGVFCISQERLGSLAAVMGCDSVSPLVAEPRRSTAARRRAKGRRFAGAAGAAAGATVADDDSAATR